MNAKSKKKFNIKLRVLSAVSAVLCLVLLSAIVFRSTPYTAFAEDAASSYNIYNAEELIDYAKRYADGSYNPNDTLVISIANGSICNLSDDPDFHGIGTNARPFSGTIQITDGQFSTFCVKQGTPLFNVVTSDMKIVNQSGADRGITLICINDFSGNTAPIFANTVRKGMAANDAVWDVTLNPDNVSNSPNIYTPDFGGVIGTIESGCKVDVTFKHVSVDTNGVKANVVCDGNAGLICGTLQSGAELTVHIDDDSLDGISVVSQSGNAGGIAGEMTYDPSVESGKPAKIIFEEDYTTIANVESKSGNKGAGGIAGKAVNGIIELGADITLTVSKSIKSNTSSGSAGGFFGIYENTSDVIADVLPEPQVFDLKGYAGDSGCSVTGNACGGFAGKFTAVKSVRFTDSTSGLDLTDDTYARQVAFTNSSNGNGGGLIGEFKQTVLSKTLEIEKIKVKITGNSGTTGGAIGKISDDSNAYVKVNGLAVENTSGTCSGGIIGKMSSYANGDNGSFLDVYGYFRAKGNFSSGIVNTMNTGVIRLQGCTDLNGATCGAAQLVGTRGNGLVYAVGTGGDGGGRNALENGKWSFYRGNGGVDDIGDWGEVLRVVNNGANKESTYFTVDPTAHTVTVKAAVTSMANIDQFILTALNIQLNDKDRGALKFNSTDVRGSNLLHSNLAITNDIDLSGTGIVALTRDNGDNAVYTGAFNGNSHKITLAIGETYGYAQADTSTAKTKTDIGDNNWGTVHNHHYLGLFAKIGGASVTNLEIDGFISTRTNANSTYSIGGVAARAYGSSLTLSGVKTSHGAKIYYGSSAGASMKINCGGAIGAVDEAATGTYTISGCVFNTDFNEKRGASRDTYFGGAIGRVFSVKSLTFDVDNTKLGGTYDDTVDSSGFSGVHYGGLIGYIDDNAGGTFSRKVNINNVTVTDRANIVTKVSSDSDRTAGAGAFLGSEWYDVEVAIGTIGSADGVIIGDGSDGSRSPTISVPSGSGKANIGALVYKTTGYWKVNHVNVAEAVIKNDNASRTFGFIANDGITSSSALYLELYSPGYDIHNTSVTGSGSFEVYDEIVAYSSKNTDIEDNGAAILSIHIGTDGDAVIMDGSGCNTYQNQTTYGKNTVKYNPNSRYYYNLDVIRAKASPSAGEKLLLWSVDRYSHSALKPKAYFENAFTTSGTITGDCDMYGLSYYPVNASGVTISNAIVKFYNKEIETAEELSSGGSDSFARTTHVLNGSHTQHYLMHQGLFLNYTGSMTVNGLTLKGNVGKDEGDSGFLVRRHIGDGTNSVHRISIKDLTLAGAYISNRDAGYGDYAPLLINTMGKNVKFSLTGVSASVGTGADEYAAAVPSPIASGLLGNIGSDTAEGISLTFSDIRLDARTAESSESGLTTAYGTQKSLFDRATLVNKFEYLKNSSAVYNYTYDEDWTGSQHHVTYGKEVTTSAEYANKQKKYYDDTTHWTNPDDSACSSEYSFSSGWRPYVYNDNNTYGTGYYHEIKVNVKDTDLDKGCGRYNDPYLIEDGNMLATISKIIDGTADDGVSINLPNDIASNLKDGWCNGKTSHTTYTKSGSNFTAPGKTSIAVNKVREYLAGAYYMVTGTNVVIDDSLGFLGLGSVSDAGTSLECAYAFRGVIVGNGNTITNETAVPLIMSANGCVVRDLTVTVDAAIEISQTTLDTFKYTNGCDAYGAVIGKVMGGDNIIENVSVTFVRNNGITANGSSHQRLVPVGGYIGVVVNGGVIFRNMGDAVRTGLTAEKCEFVTDPGWLYVNPIIGRVIAGYAFCESNTFAATDSTATMKNGTKNYSIPDLIKPVGDEEEGYKNKLEVNTTSSTAYTVTVPDGQALYILSCIINSGAGSAGYNATAEQTYDRFSDANQIYSAYRKYTTTRSAAYSDVGSTAADADACADYQKVLTTDAAAAYIYSGATKIPYIIRYYTKSTSGTYKARSMCDTGGTGTSATKTVSLTLSANGNFEVPAGYRGIGNIYYDNAKLNIKFKVFNGNGNTVTLHMNYQEYNHLSGNQNTKTNTDATKTNENYQPYDYAGFGLINRAKTSSLSSSNSVKNLTLAGSVFYDIRKVSNGAQIRYTYGWHNYNNLTGYYPDIADRFDNAGNNPQQNILRIGGVIGSCADSVYLNGVTLDGLSVEGAMYTGGMIGYSTGKAVTIDAPETTDIRVIGGMFAGGLIGGFYGSNDLTIKGSSSKTAVIDFTEIKVKGEPSTAKIDFKDANFSHMFHCGGGLCGYASAGDAKTITVQYVRIKDGALTAPNKTKRPSDMRYKIFLGGMFGRLESSKIAIEHSSVEGVPIDGNTCGGLIGCSRNKLDGTITDVTVKGGTGLKIDATNMAGGLIGYYFGGSSFQLDISSVILEDYEIKSTTDSEKASAGGIMGTFTITSGNKFNIYDSIIRNCTISRVATYVTGDDKLLGVGGLFGAITESAGNVTGHNLLLDTVTVQNNGGNKAPGMIVGTNQNGNSFQFVGVSMQNGTAKTISAVGVSGSTGMFGTNGYVIMADRDGVLSNESANSSLYNDTVSPTDYDHASPYVTVNPLYSIGNSGLQLTGDGVSATVAGLPIKGIIEEGTSDKRYGYVYAATNVDGASTGHKYFNVFNSSKLSTFNREQGTSFANDFAVLIVDEMDETATTNLINSCINLLANTNYPYVPADGKYGYAENKANVYKVDIYKIIYDETEGKFVKSGEEEASLKRAHNAFFMNSNEADTSGIMFSLIDVSYYDPKDNTKIAYHLYIPVLVKKLLKFDFEIATGAGTNYESAWYVSANRFGKALMENLGTPTSIYFRYTYLRTQSEWQMAIENQESLLRNFDKTLTVTVPDASSGSFPSGTIMVLVDPNRGGKAYYATTDTALSGGVLDLSAFRETYGDSSSPAFEPVQLNDMLSMTASANAAGLFVATTESDATVRVGSTYYRLYDSETDGSATRYSITVTSTDEDIYDLGGHGLTPVNAVKMVERYYISFFTPSGTSGSVLYHSVISAPGTFDDTAYPSRMDNINKTANETDSVHMYLGNIFEQEGFSVSATNSNGVMGGSNLSVGADFTATVKVNSTIYPLVRSMLGVSSPIQIYQSFVLQLSVNENGSIEKYIAGSPTPSGNYSIVSVGDPSITVSGDYGGFTQSSAYVEGVNGVSLNRYLTNGGAAITGSITLSYPEENIPEQFPYNRDNGTDESGAKISGSSNVAYSPDTTAFSTCVVSDDDTNDYLYYCIMEGARPTLEYNVKSYAVSGDYAPLGINPWDSEAVFVSTVGYYNVESVSDKVAGYNSMRVTVTLSKKSDYTEKLNIETYLGESLTLGLGASEFGVSHPSDYEYVFDIYDVGSVHIEGAADTEFEIPVVFSVITGDDFEAAGLEYSNYRVTLEVKLYKTEAGREYACNDSYASDYLVYTNARIVPEFLTP